VRDLGIHFPVGQDNGYQTWRAWSNRAWPAFYLLDGNSQIVMSREGEGHSVVLEQAIRSLLGLPAAGPRHPPEEADLSRIGSPEVYFGATHPTPQEAAQSPQRGEATYTFGQVGPQLNRYELEGRWVREGEALTLRSDNGGMRMRYAAAKVHVVAAAMNSIPLRVRSGTGAWRSIGIKRPKLYTLVDGDTYADQVVEIQASELGLTLYSSTFG